MDKNHSSDRHSSRDHKDDKDRHEKKEKHREHHEDDRKEHKKDDKKEYPREEYKDFKKDDLKRKEMQKNFPMIDKLIKNNDKPENQGTNSADAVMIEVIANDRLGKKVRVKCW
jgi:hypothetical protein